MKCNRMTGHHQGLWAFEIRVGLFACFRHALIQNIFVSRLQLKTLSSINLKINKVIGHNQGFWNWCPSVRPSGHAHIWSCACLSTFSFPDSNTIHWSIWDLTELKDSTQHYFENFSTAIMLHTSQSAQSFWKMVCICKIYCQSANYSCISSIIFPQLQSLTKAGDTVQFYWILVQTCHYRCDLIIEGDCIILESFVIIYLLVSGIKARSSGFPDKCVIHLVTIIDFHCLSNFQILLHLYWYKCVTISRHLCSLCQIFFIIIFICSY